MFLVLLGKSNVCLRGTQLGQLSTDKLPKGLSRKYSVAGRNGLKGNNPQPNKSKDKFIVYSYEF